MYTTGVAVYWDAHTCAHTCADTNAVNREDTWIGKEHADGFPRHAEDSCGEVANY